MQFLFYIILASSIADEDYDEDDEYKIDRTQTEYQPFAPGKKGRITEIAKLTFQVNGKSIGHIGKTFFGPKKIKGKLPIQRLVFLVKLFPRLLKISPVYVLDGKMMRAHFSHTLAAVFMKYHIFTA